LEYITSSSICKAHGNQAAGEAEDLGKKGNIIGIMLIR